MTAASDRFRAAQGPPDTSQEALLVLGCHRRDILQRQLGLCA